MSGKRETRCIRLAALAGVALALCGGSAMAGDTASSNTITLVPAYNLPPAVLGGPYSDVDKLNLSTLTNWYDDLNANGKHDPGEPFAATSQAGWHRPVQAADNSCWLASGVNMLAQLGLVTDAKGLYMDYALNGVTSPGGMLTWDDGGLQQYVISQWAAQHAAQRRRPDFRCRSSCPRRCWNSPTAITPGRM